MTQINLNVAPYHDDYQDSKNFHRILFQPGVSVQARELTQMQTILQKQIERFGRHVLKEGSLVLGGAYDLEVGIDIVKIETPLSLAAFDGQEIVGSVSGVKAYVRTVSQDLDNGHSVLFIRYTNQGLNGESVFTAGESISLVNDSFTTATVLAADHTGKGSIFGIAEGVVFTKGFFVMFPAQRIVLSLYSDTPTETVGFVVDQRVVTAEEDLSLLDNAQGTTNYAAPGADRFTIHLTLSKLSSLINVDSSNFVELLVVTNGQVAETFERSQYARIYEEIAKRTYDESGDYFVRGLNVRTREHLDTGSNEGYLKAVDGGDSDLIDVGIEPGLAYVKGYEVNTLVTSHISVPKSNTYSFVNDQILTARNGGYLVLNQVTGTPPSDLGTQVQLLDTAELRLNNRIRNTVAPTGQVVGTARVKFISRDDGTLAGSTGTLRMYLFDVRMTTGSLSDAKAVYLAGATPFFADIKLVNNVATIQESNYSDMLVPFGTSATRTVRDEDGVTDTAFFFNRTEMKSADTTAAGGVFTITITTTSESVPYGSTDLGGSLSSVEKSDFIIAAVQDKEFALPGTVTYSSGQSALSGTGTFFTRLNVGDRIKINSDSYFIASISTDTSATIIGTFATGGTNQAFSRMYMSGDLIDLNQKGSTGEVRTVTVDTVANTMTVDLKEVTTAGGTVAVLVTYKVMRTSAVEVKKHLRANRYVKIDCSSIDITKPISLGFSDVWKIHEVRKHTDPFVLATDGVDVTGAFKFHNGQTDNSYEHGTITPLSPLDSGDHLLVKLDYFEPDFSEGVGYFSVDSYPVNDDLVSDTSIFTYQIPYYTTTGGFVYNLRDCLDFRIVRTNSANDSTTVAGASTNPVNTVAYHVNGTAGARMAMVNSPVFVDYSYYLARRDLILIKTDGTFTSIQGAPGLNPVSPVAPDTAMALAQVYVPPYPSISESLARILGGDVESVVVERLANIRYTMRDIGVIKSRVDNLEYYNALNLLEKSVVDLTIPDENGLDRFKNGFFVDGFMDHSLGDVADSDYNIAVDKAEQVIRPVFTMDSINLKWDEASSSNVQLTGNLLSLPYTETVLVDQPRVTTTRNIEQSVFRFVGTIEVTPDNDTWMDVKTVDKKISFGPETPPPDRVLSTEWGSWQVYHTGIETTEFGGGGYKVYQRKFGDRDTNTVSGSKFVGSYASYSQALKAAKGVGTLGQISSADRAKIVGGGSSTTVTEDSIRKGVQTNLVHQRETQTLGNFVTDVALMPYIRSQYIKCHVKGVKANTRMHVFFDGENMNEYFIPLQLSTDPFDDIMITPQALMPGEAYSDEYGELLGYIMLPDSGKRFRVGTKEIVFTDSPTNAVDATTYAKGYFMAQGMSVQKQNTILSTMTTVVKTTQLTETKRDVRTTSTPQKIEIFGPSCMAYSFFVDVPPENEGVFLTSVDVFVSSMHPTLGMWFEIREMDSAGGITRNQVPYSEVWMKRNDPRIQLWNGQGTPVATKVNFPSPVFLMNNTQYAFVIHTEGLNPDTYFWVSRLGETDIITGEPVVGRQLKGTLYTTNNNLNYDMVQDVDLMIKFNRANFQTGVVGSASLFNKPVEYLNVEPTADVLRRYGETVWGSQKLQLTAITGEDTIVVGDKITGTSSGEVGTVLQIVGSSYYTDGMVFEDGESITVTTSADVAKDFTATIASFNRGVGVMRSYDSTTNKIILDNSNGQFYPGSKILARDSELSTTVVSIDKYRYSTTNLKPHYLTFANTELRFAKRGTDSNTNTLGFFEEGAVDSSSSYETENAILSRSHEIELLGSAASAQVIASMQTTSSYISPVVDVNRANMVLVHNLINNDATGEEGVGGSLINKYISKQVILADGQDAEDLLVLLTAYRPTNSDIKVWMKIQNNQDTGTLFSNRPWIEMERSSDQYSSSANLGDFKEFSFKVPAAYLTDENDIEQGIVQYQANGATYTGFKRFAIKIGLMGTNSALVPRVGDLRAIALQK